MKHFHWRSNKESLVLIPNLPLIYCLIIVKPLSSTGLRNIFCEMKGIFMSLLILRIYDPLINKFFKGK